MRGAFVGIVGAAVLLASAVGLTLGAIRAGPMDRTLEPVEVPASHHATYSTGSSAPLGVCLAPPCPTATELDLRLEGLPHVPYGLRLEEADGSGVVALGTFVPVAGVVEVHWSDDGENAGVDRVVLSVAGRDVGSVPVRGLGTLILSWQAAPATVHANEIGAVTVSTVATLQMDEAAPDGWEFRAWMDGRAGRVHLGGFGRDLDGRVERARLADQDTFTVVLAPQGAAKDDGFPVLWGGL